MWSAVLVVSERLLRMKLAMGLADGSPVPAEEVAALMQEVVAKFNMPFSDYNDNEPLTRV